MTQAPGPAEVFAHSQWVLELARRLVGEASAGEVAQQTLTAALRRAPTGDRPLRPWLQRVAVRFAAKWRRAADRRRRHEAAAAHAHDASVPSAADLAESADLLRAVVHELSRLDAPLRDVVSLSCMQGLNSREIAERLGIPAGTVRWRLARGLEDLRQRMDARCGGDRRRWVAVLGSVAGARTGATAAALGLGAGLRWLLLAAAAGVAVTIALVAARTPTLAPPPVRQERLAVASNPVGADTDPIGERTRLDVPVAPSAAATARAAASGIALPAGSGGVRARIVDAAGVPRHGADLSWPAGTDAFAYADADGQVWLTLRPPTDRAPLEFAIEHRPSAVVRRRAIVQVGSWTDLGDIALPAAQPIHGRVVDERQQPLAGATVFAVAADADLSAATLREAGPMELEAYAVRRVTTGGDGTFRLDDAPALPLRVFAVAPDRCFAGSPVLAPDRERLRDAGDLACDPLPPGSALCGRVVAAGGAPLADARVRMLPRRPGEPAGHRLLAASWHDVARDGTFALPARLGVPCDLLVEAPGYEPWRQDDIAAGGELRIELVEAR